MCHTASTILCMHGSAGLCHYSRAAGLCRYRRAASPYRSSTEVRHSILHLAVEQSFCWVLWPPITVQLSHPWWPLHHVLYLLCGACGGRFITAVSGQLLKGYRQPVSPGTMVSRILYKLICCAYAWCANDCNAARIVRTSAASSPLHQVLFKFDTFSF